MSSKFKDLIQQARSRDSEVAKEDLETEVEPKHESISLSEIAASKFPDSTPSNDSTLSRTSPDDDEETHPLDAQSMEPAPSLTAIANVPSPPAKGRGRPRGKRSDPDYEQISAYISKKTHLDVKIALLQEGQGREFSELVEELLVGWLVQK